MILWLKLAAAASALAGAAYGGWWVRDAAAAKADLAREQAGAKAAHRQAETALRGAQQHEVDREHIRARLRVSEAATAAALASPVPQCPALAVGDVVLPGDALARVRIAAGEQQPVAADPGQSGPGLRLRPADPPR